MTARHKIYRVKVIKEGRPRYCAALKQPQNVYDFLKKEIGNETREVFVAIFLNAKNIPLNWSIISIGSLTASIVHPRETFAPGIIEQEVYTKAVTQKASSVIIAHNHISGSVDPSPDDQTITKQLVQAGKILGIDVLEHLIIGDNTYFSFAEGGLL